MSLPNLPDLEAEWAVFMENRPGPRNGWTQDQRWRADNPGEFDLLLQYRGGGPRPTLNTEPGRRMVLHVSAYLKAKEVVPPPTSQFGARLHEGFEWALTEDVVRVSTLAQLTTSQNTKLTMLPDATISGTRVLKTNANPWRLRRCAISGGSPEDNIKGDGARFMDIDGCGIHHAPRQGILAGLSGFSDVVIRNSRVHDNGTSGAFDHGAYIGYGSRLLLYNCVFENNAAYQLHLYPQYTDVLVVCCTFRGGRGSIISGARNVRFIGCRFDYASRTDRGGYGLEQYQPSTNVTIQDCGGDGNELGGYNVPGAAVIGWGATTVRESLWDWVPPFDIDGTPRTAATVGAYA